MNSDIRIAVTFKGHRKRKRLRLALGPGATDHLLDLWITTALNRPSGVLTGMDETDIALDAGWEGDPAVFVKALLDCGFLERDEDGTFRLHDWEEHQSWACKADERTAKAKKAADARWEKSKADAPEMLRACSEHAQGNAPLLSSPLLTLPEKKSSARASKKCPASPSSEFEEFWNAYPARNGQKVKKAKAWEAFWRITTTTDITPEFLTDRIRALAPTYGDFPRDAVTWLNQKGWQDEAGLQTDGYAPALPGTPEFERQLEELRAYRARKACQ